MAEEFDADDIEDIEKDYIDELGEEVSSDEDAIDNPNPQSEDEENEDESGEEFDIYDENEPLDDIHLIEKKKIKSTKKEKIEVEKFDKFHKKNIIIPPEDFTTSDYLTDFELTEIISIRATQISESGISLIKAPDNVDTAERIAELELNAGLCPLVLERKIQTVYERGMQIDYYEHWDVNKMNKKIL